MQIPTDLLTSLSRAIIIRSLFYLLADLVLASHADVIRGVVFPSSHKLLLLLLYFQENWVGMSFTLPETLTLFQTKICDFRYHISDLIKNWIPCFRPEK